MLTLNVFSRAAHYLGDYADLYTDAFIDGDGSDSDNEQIASRDELIALRDRMRELCGEWEKKVAIDGPTNAANIIASMLADWKLPGAVWYKSAQKRFRLTGEGYKPEVGDICVGVYMPGVAAEMLVDDFKEVMTC